MTTYLNARLGSEAEHLLGEKPSKTLRLNQEARALLLADYRRLPRSIEPIAREWEKWLKGSQPTLSVTFEQETASENPKTVHLSVLHPLVRQAAHFLDITEPKYFTLTRAKHRDPARRLPFRVVPMDQARDQTRRVARRCRHRAAA